MLFPPHSFKMALKFNWVSFFRIFSLLLLIAAIIIACFTLPIEKILKDFLAWIEQDLGPWGPLVLIFFTSPDAVDNI